MFYISSAINYGISATSTLYTAVPSPAGNLLFLPLRISIGKHHLNIGVTEPAVQHA